MIYFLTQKNTFKMIKNDNLTISILEKDNLLEFLQVFNSDFSCKMYLFNLKWENSFECKRCKHSNCYVTKEKNCECTRCHYTETPTSGTIFHNVKFGLQKAFAIFYEISKSYPRKVSAKNISIRYSLTAKTSLKYIRMIEEILKLYNAMSIEGNIIFNNYKIAL